MHFFVLTNTGEPILPFIHLFIITEKMEPGHDSEKLHHDLSFLSVQSSFLMRQGNESASYLKVPLVAL